jgi:hypothetical protein
MSQKTSAARNKLSVAREMITRLLTNELGDGDLLIENALWTPHVFPVGLWFADPEQLCSQDKPDDEKQCGSGEKTFSAVFTRVYANDGKENGKSSRPIGRQTINGQNGRLE